MKKWILACVVVLGVGLGIRTYTDLQSFEEINTARGGIQTLQVVDRNFTPLSVSYMNRWNTYDYLALNQIPTLLQQAFIVSEDRHFYEHRGIDWNARGMAIWNAIRFQKSPRGARTISEQVVRIFHPRPRTIWSKWLETLEVVQLERQFSKPEILEAYLNEVPYAANRRGVLQAARFYFDRNLSTLSVKEMLALVILVRAPSRYDLFKRPLGIDSAIGRLATRMQEQGLIDLPTLSQVGSESFDLKTPREPVNASHFVTFIRGQKAKEQAGRKKENTIHTTLDANIQEKVQGLLDRRIKSLARRKVHNGGALVVDHRSGEIIAWVVAGANRDPKKLIAPSDQIDTILSPRQPGSSLKPFLYALALDSGWNAATIIEDSPLANMIGQGYHRFNNYSHTFYGDVTLRQALGNSLNIPALRTISFTGVPRYFETLHKLGFRSLTKSHTFYDEGLALGNGEVSLFEIVQAYAALAHHGRFRPLQYLVDQGEFGELTQVFSDEASSLIANMLSDPMARQLEFGANSILNLPVQTAVKTGTSSDYHDAWAVGFNYRYVVGIWMGNLDREPTKGLTGALGPALTLRSIFAELTKNEETEPLYLSPRLVKAEVCIEKKGKPCRVQSEYFMKAAPIGQTVIAAKPPYRITLPTPGLQVAFDPRVPAYRQKLPLKINRMEEGDKVEWTVDGKLLTKTSAMESLWPLTPGTHAVTAVITQKDKRRIKLAEVEFTVK